MVLEFAYEGLKCSLHLKCYQESQPPVKLSLNHHLLWFQVERIQQSSGKMLPRCEGRSAVPKSKSTVQLVYQSIIYGTYPFIRLSNLLLFQIPSGEIADLDPFINENVASSSTTSQLDNILFDQLRLEYCLLFILRPILWFELISNRYRYWYALSDHVYRAIKVDYNVP